MFNQQSSSWITMNKHDRVPFYKLTESFMICFSRNWIAFLKQINPVSENLYGLYRILYCYRCFICFLCLTLTEFYILRASRVFTRKWINSDIWSVIKQITWLKVKTKKVSKVNFQGFLSRRRFDTTSESTLDMRSPIKLSENAFHILKHTLKLSYQV